MNSRRVFFVVSTSAPQELTRGVHHNGGWSYETFPAAKAHRILQRLEFHHTPKHASWLNMVEIEIGLPRGQCGDRRIAERERLVSDIKAWQQQRNTSGARTD